MACRCEEIECLSVVPAICSDEIILTLEATETGTWLVQYDFNGRLFGVEIEVTNGERISLPKVFNENYTHTLEFYKTDLSLFNDKCYSLDTSKIACSVSGATPSTSTELGYYEYIVVDTVPEEGLDANGRMQIAEGSTIEDARLIGKIVTSLIGGGSYNSGDYTKVKSSDALTMNNISFIKDMVLTLYYI